MCHSAKTSWIHINMLVVENVKLRVISEKTHFRFYKLQFSIILKLY